MLSNWTLPLQGGEQRTNHWASPVCQDFYREGTFTIKYSKRFLPLWASEHKLKEAKSNVKAKLRKEKKEKVLIWRLQAQSSWKPHQVTEWEQRGAGKDHNSSLGKGWSCNVKQTDLVTYFFFTTHFSHYSCQAVMLQSKLYMKFLPSKPRQGESRSSVDGDILTSTISSLLGAKALDCATSLHPRWLSPSCPSHPSFLHVLTAACHFWHSREIIHSLVTFAASSSWANEAHAH